MGKFNEYTQKATPEDADSLMIYDAAAKANKLSPFSGIWNWIVGKLTNAVISNLQTNNKTVLGAINELNSKALESEVRICSPGKAFEKALRNNKIVLIFISTLDSSNVKSTGFGIVATRGADNYSGKYTEFFPIDSDVIVSLDGNNLKINSSNNWLRANIITL